MQSAIKTIIVSGFLGAGKTTFVNSLLHELAETDFSYAVVINEFGVIGIDANLLHPGKYKKYEINKGSIFCICTKTDLLHVLYDAVDNVHPDLLLIEASGVAEPRDLDSILNLPRLKNQFSPIHVCVVDPLTFPKIASTLTAAKKQVASADLIIINKADLTEKEVLDEIEKQIRFINHDANVCRTRFAEITFTRLLQVEPSNHDDLPPRDAPPDDICSISYSSTAAVHRKKFYDFLERNHEFVLRAKGNVKFPDKTFFVEIAAGRLQSKPAANLDDQHQETKFVLICRGLKQDDVIAELKNCELKDSL